MKFFVPTAKDDKHAEEMWHGIKKSIASPDWPVGDRRIFRLTYRHNGYRYKAVVGQIEPRVGEIVLAIFESAAYLVCTENFALNGGPMLVGKEDVIRVQSFENF